jgi:hypothetical protein
MRLLDDKAQLEAHFGPYGHSANLAARSVPFLRRTYHWLRNCFGRTGWNSNLILVHLETVLVLVQDRCTGSANVAQAKKLFRMHPIE